MPASGCTLLVEALLSRWGELRCVSLFTAFTILAEGSRFRPRAAAFAMSRRAAGAFGGKSAVPRIFGFAGNLGLVLAAGEAGESRIGDGGTSGALVCLGLACGGVAIRTAGLEIGTSPAGGFGGPFSFAAGRLTLFSFAKAERAARTFGSDFRGASISFVVAPGSSVRG